MVFKAVNITCIIEFWIINVFIKLKYFIVCLLRGLSKKNNSLIWIAPIQLDAFKWFIEVQKMKDPSPHIHKTQLNI